MKVSLLQENFASALVSAKPFVGSSGTIPICGMVRLTTDQGMLRIDTTDLERGFSTWVGAIVDEEGGICVSHQKLTDFVRTLPSDRLDITVDATDADDEPSIDSGSLVLSIRSGDTEAAVNGQPVDDFPSLLDTKIETPVSALFDPDELAINIRRVRSVAATDNSRPILTGIFLKFEDGDYEMAAADGFRLALQSGSAIETPEEPQKMVISARTLAALEKLLKDTEDPVRLNIDQSNSRACFEVGRHLVMAQLMGGTYPNYAQLVPDNLPWQVQVNSQDLKGAVESAAVYAVDGSNIIRFWVENTPAPENLPDDAEVNGNGLVRVSARTEEVGYAKREARCAEVSGLDGEETENMGRIAFNFRYMRDLLKVDTGPVVLAASNPSSPGLWTFPNASGYKQVVMPMYCQW